MSAKSDDDDSSDDDQAVGGGAVVAKSSKSSKAGKKNFTWGDEETGLFLLPFVKAVAAHNAHKKTALTQDVKFAHVFASWRADAGVKAGYVSNPALPELSARQLKEKFAKLVKSGAPPRGSETTACTPT